MATIKDPFNYSLYEVLNGINTFKFDRLVASLDDIDKYLEGATHAVKMDGSVKLYGIVKERSAKESQKIETITMESILCLLRDTETSSADPYPLMRANTLIAEILPHNEDGSERYWYEYNATRAPLIRYATRSGSILTHLNTIAAMSGLNWRYECSPATTATAPEWSKIIVSDGETDSLEDTLILKENVDLFHVTLDRSLYKKYSQVNVIGVEKEISGYITTASLLTDMEDVSGASINDTYFYLDCDDALLAEEEIIPANDPHDFLTHIGESDCIWMQKMVDVVGWGNNDVFLVDDEFIKYENTYNHGSESPDQGVSGISREQWYSIGNTPHIYGTDCLITQKMAISPASSGETITSQISPATDYFKIGAEIICADSISDSQIELATVDPSSKEYLGRGVYDSPMYAHTRGAIIQPYYPDSYSVATQYKTLQVTLHGKGIVTKDGCDKLAWGVLTNIQNGILSGSGTYRATDFFDNDITVGKKFTLETATRTNEPATSYDLMIYSIKRSQNRLMEIEFGNVSPEILHMLKSGDYALQAAVRKDDVNTRKDVQLVSIGGALALESDYAVSETPQTSRRYRIGGY